MPLASVHKKADVGTLLKSRYLFTKQVRPTFFDLFFTAVHIAGSRVRCTLGLPVPQLVRRFGGRAYFISHPRIRSGALPTATGQPAGSPFLILKPAII